MVIRIFVCIVLSLFIDFDVQWNEWLDDYKQQKERAKEEQR